ncbi:MAG: tRNA (adenosine(37)-N6)-dimethylallyltransferase MiaA [Lacisediminihabitans sp.]
MISRTTSAEFPLVAVVGATGTGKSELSLDIAEAIAALGRHAEIVNADAMQLYRGMDVGTAKLSTAARRGIPHHLLDILAPSDEASVADYQVDARAAIRDIQARGAVPILVGGSGLYVSSVLYDFRFPGTDADIRARLEAELAESGPGGLYRRLRELDSVAASAIGPHNGRRLVRALEVVEITGEPFGAGLPDDAAYWCPTVTIGLRAPRAELVTRLDARVERMWAAGLVDEVRGLISGEMGEEKLGVTASRAIGYAQALAQLRGEISESEAIEHTATLTRKYARRQVSWFKRYSRLHWLEYDSPALVEDARQLILPYD